MGLYSTNRVTSTIAGTNDSTYNENLSSSSSAIVPSLMESTIQILEFEQKMFETLIECDFLSVHDKLFMEDGEKKFNIKTIIEEFIIKIRELFEKARKIIVDNFNKFKDKFNQLNNEELVKKYKEALEDPENMEGFSGIDKIKILFLIDQHDPNVVVDFVQEKYEEIINLNNSDDIGEIIEEVETKFKNFTDSIGIDSEIAYDYIPDHDEIKEALNYLSKNELAFKSLKTNHNDLLNMLNKCSQTARSILNINDDNDEINTVKLNAITKISAKATTYAEYYLNTILNYNVELIKHYRKIVSVCGAYALKKQSENESNIKHESVEYIDALLYSIGEASDDYIDSIFSY